MLTIPFQGELSDLIHTNNAWNMAGTVSVFAVTVQEVSNFTMAKGFSALQWCKSGMHSVENILGI